MFRQQIGDFKLPDTSRNVSVHSRDTGLKSIQAGPCHFSIKGASEESPGVADFKLPSSRNLLGWLTQVNALRQPALVTFPVATGLSHSVSSKCVAKDCVGQPQGVLKGHKTRCTPCVITGGWCSMGHVVIFISGCWKACSGGLQADLPNGKGEVTVSSGPSPSAS